MAPYTALLRGMTREQKQIVVTFIIEPMEEQTTQDNAEIIREKYKRLKISPDIQRLRGCMKLTEEEMQDERTKYLLEL